MNRLINLVPIIVLILSSHCLMAQQSPQEANEGHYEQRHDEQFTGAITPQPGYEGQFTGDKTLLDAQAERERDLNTLTYNQFSLKYGFTGDVGKEYLRHQVENKLAPELTRKKLQEEADIQLARDLKSMLLVLGLLFLIAVVFLIRKFIPVVKVMSKQAAEKLKIIISNTLINLKKVRLKRRFEDKVVEEIIKQKIKAKVKAEAEIDNAFKNNGTSASSIDLTKLKQDISTALKNGEYDKAKELTDLAEKLEKLN